MSQFFHLWLLANFVNHFGPVGEPGAMELTWMQVPGEKLLEPLVNMVIKFTHTF